MCHKKCSAYVHLQSCMMSKVPEYLVLAIVNTRYCNSKYTVLANIVEKYSDGTRRSVRYGTGTQTARTQTARYTCTSSRDPYRYESLMRYSCIPVLYYR